MFIRGLLLHTLSFNPLHIVTSFSPENKQLYKEGIIISLF